MGAFRETLKSLRTGSCTRVREIGSGDTAEAATDNVTSEKSPQESTFEVQAHVLEDS